MCHLRQSIGMSRGDDICIHLFIHSLGCYCIVLVVYPKKYAHGFCFAVLCCGYTLTDFPISIRLTSLALWQSNDCPSASKATLMNMDKYFMWIHYERLHDHNKAKHNKTVCTFLGIYYTLSDISWENAVQNVISRGQRYRLAQLTTQSPYHNNHSVTLMIAL